MRDIPEVKPTTSSVYEDLTATMKALKHARQAEQTLAEKLFCLDRRLDHLNQQVDRYVWNDC